MMVDETIIYALVSAMFVVTLLLIAAIHSRLHWILKSILIVATLVVMAMGYRGIYDRMGWPVKGELPDSFRFISALVDEPRDGSKGGIFVWHTTPDNREPRSIEMPYSKEMHRMMSKANGMVAQGQKVYMGRKANGMMMGQGTPGKKGGDGKLASKGSGQSEDQSPGPLDFIPPPDTLPSKD